MMPIELISIVVLVAIFLIATVGKVHMGALALVAAAAVGMGAAGLPLDEVLAGFPVELFLVLTGVTFLFAIAKANGTIDWLVEKAVGAVGGRIWAIPWMILALSAVLAGTGAVPPAAVAIIAPTALRLAHRHDVSPLLMSLMVANGVSAGAFSPIGVFGLVVNDIAAGRGIVVDPLGLFAATLVVNVVICLIVFLVVAGRRAATTVAEVPAARRAAVAVASADTALALTDRAPRPPAAGADPSLAGTGPADATSGPSAEHERAARGTPTVVITVVGLLVMVVSVVGFDLDIGVAALTLAVLLSLICPVESRAAVGQVAWPTVFLVVGIVTYVNLLQDLGTIDAVATGISAIGSPLLVALLLCLVAATVSAFASTTGILGALVPLAVPFLLSGQVDTTAMLIVLCLSASIVDASPFSTTGALLVANTDAADRDRLFRQLLWWGTAMIAVVPAIGWGLFVLPSW